MDVSIIAKDNVGVIVLKGDLDFQSYKDLESAFENALERKPEVVAIDLAEVPHIDSVGLGTVTKLWKNASQKSVAFVLAGPRKNVRSMIKLVNLDGRIKIVDSVEDALS